MPQATGEEKLIFENLTSTIKRMEKLAVVGVNGAGKSTLLKIMANQTEPTDGSVQVALVSRLVISVSSLLMSLIQKTPF